MKKLFRPNSSERSVERNKNNENNVIDPVPEAKLKLIEDYLIDYAENSNLHGLKYIGEKERTTVEKLFWALTVSCSVVLCAFLIHEIFVKWNESPMIVTFAEKTTPVWHIPNPAVTICSEVRIKPKKFNFTKYYHIYENKDVVTTENLTEQEKDMFEHASLICNYNTFRAKGRNFSIDTIRKISPSNYKVFIRCMWNQNRMPCNKIFSPIITEKGICHTFNIMDPAELFRKENLHNDYEHLKQRNKTHTWSLEAGYPPSAPLETYPHRGSGHGLSGGLSLLLQAFMDDVDYLCSGPIQGFKILLHSPAELPRLSQHFISLPVSQKILIAIKPKMITTSEGLRPYDFKRRQCYFQDQRYLSYFKFYTQNNCQMECFVNFTYKLCGCVQFGLPHGPHMEICDASLKPCIRAAQKELLKIEIQSEQETSNVVNNTLDEARAIAAQCNCLPACTSIEYESEISQAEFDWMRYFEALRLPYNYNKNMQASSAKIYFKEAQFITSKRSELYGLKDFLANCGGLLSLFMGFSILSLVEIIYFLTLRLWCLIRRHPKRNSVINKLKA